MTEPDFRTLFENAPALNLVLARDFTIVAASNAYLAATLTTREDIIGRNVFDAFPDNPLDPHANGTKNLRASLERVLRDGVADVMPTQKYDIRERSSGRGEFETRYWHPINFPILDSAGKVIYIIHQVEDVTEVVRLQENRSQSDAANKALTVRAEKAEAESSRHSHQLNEAQRELKVAKEIAEAEHEALSKSEHARGELEARWQRAFSTETVGVLFFTLTGQIVTANKTFERMVGYTADELMHAAHWKMLTPPEFMEVTSRAAQELATVGRTDPYEKQLTRKDGSRWWGLFAPSRLSGSGDNAQCIEFVIDITEAKQAEEALRHREAEFRAMFESFGVGMAQAEPTTRRMIRVNEAFCAITGYSESELLHMTVNDLTHPEDRHSDDAKYQELMAGKIPAYQTEKRYRRKDGSVVWVLVSGNVIRGPGGEPISVSAVVQDITDRKRAEEALRSSEQRFRDLAENIPQMAWMTNADGWIFWYNKRWFEYTGSTLEEMQGWGWQAVHHPDHLPRVTEKYRKALREGGLWEDTFPLRGKDGKFRWFLSRAFPIHDSNGNITGWFGTNTDIQELVEARQRWKELTASLEQQVRDRTASLEESNRELEAFTYTIAHDLRAPLRAQQGFALALVEDFGDVLGKVGLDYANRIIASAHRLSELIDDLLAFSRLSRAAMGMEQLDLERMVAHVCDEMEFEIKEARARIHLSQLRFHVCGHAPTLRAALTNLISNAVKFAKPDVTPEVHVWAEDRGEMIRLHVDDNGIGVAPEHHHQIFGVFNRLHNAGNYEGTGVGLAIVKKGIERMGGQVGVQSEEGRGSRFWIELHKACQTEDSPEHPEQDVPDAQSAHTVHVTS